MQIKIKSKGKSTTGTGQYGAWELMRFEVEAPYYTNQEGNQIPNYNGTAGVFRNDENAGWRAGDSPEVESIEEKINTKDGKTYKNYNIVMPKKTKAQPQNNEEVLKALREVYKTIKRVEIKLDAKLTEQAIDEINNEANSDEDIPF